MERIVVWLSLNFQSEWCLIELEHTYLIDKDPYPWMEQAPLSQIEFHILGHFWNSFSQCFKQMRPNNWSQEIRAPWKWILSWGPSPVEYRQMLDLKWKKSWSRHIHGFVMWDDNPHYISSFEVIFDLLRDTERWYHCIFKTSHTLNKDLYWHIL